MKTQTIAFCLACATGTMADLIIDEDNGLVLDVLAWSGDGEQTSYLVIDFAATGGDAYAFGYHWNDTSTVLDMLIAVSNTTELVALTSDWGGWGTFLDNFTFGDETGDPANYWSHSLATPDGSGDVEWLAASGGVDVEGLTNGAISGWYNGFTDDYQTIPPSLPLTTMPAPGVLALATIVLATTRASRIRR